MPFHYIVPSHSTALRKLLGINYKCVSETSLLTERFKHENV